MPGVFLEILEFGFELSLLRVALYIGQNGLVDRGGRIVQRAGINGGCGRVGIGKLLRQGRKRGNRRAHGIDLASAQGVALIHAGNRDASSVAVEKEFVLPASAEPVAAVFPFPARHDVQAAPFVQVILERQGFQSAVADGRVVGDVLIRSLYGELPAMLHKIICAQVPDEISQIDGKADAGQNRHLKQAQSLENGSQCPHCAHKTQRHPQGTVTLAERRSLVRRPGHGNGQNPDEQGRHHSQRHQIEGAEKLQHQFRRLRTAKARAPGIPALAEKGIKDIFTGIGLEQDFRSRGKVR